MALILKMSFNPFYINFYKINEYIDDSNWIKHLILTPADDIEKYKETWDKLRYAIELENNDFNKYENKYREIRCNSDDDLLLK